MDSGKYIHFGGGTSSGERRDWSLAQIKDKLAIDDARRGISSDDIEFSRIGRHVSISDLVWCKVLGHPWWPGKVISNSIELTKGDKYFEIDSYLVVCFGNNSLAWYDVLSVKPFWENFLQLAKWSNTKSFRKAVDSALEEVSRRVKYTLTCRCMPRHIYVAVGCSFWAIDDGSDKDSSDDDAPEEVIFSTVSFVPRELVDYLLSSSVLASGSDNRLVLEAAKAQLSALFFWRSRCQKLPVYASLVAEEDGDSGSNFPGDDNHKEDGRARDSARQYKAPGSFSSSMDASVVGGSPANVDFVFLSGPTDKETGKLVTESENSLAREAGDGAGSHVGLTEIDLMKNTQRCNTPKPNIENRASGDVPMTAAEKPGDHIQPTFSHIGPVKESETRQYK